MKAKRSPADGDSVSTATISGRVDDAIRVTMMESRWGLYRGGGGGGGGEEGRNRKTERNCRNPLRNRPDLV